MNIRVHEQGFVSLEEEHRCRKDRHDAAKVIANIIGVLSVEVGAEDETGVEATQRLIDELGRELERRNWIEWKVT